MGMRWKERTPNSANVSCECEDVQVVEVEIVKVDGGRESERERTC